VGVFVFCVLFFLFFIAGHYLGVLLVFNGGTACFIGPWRASTWTWLGLFKQSYAAKRAPFAVACRRARGGFYFNHTAAQRTAQSANWGMSVGFESGTKHFRTAQALVMVLVQPP
jgi:hypothetical protein